MLVVLSQTCSLDCGANVKSAVPHLKLIAVGVFLAMLIAAPIRAAAQDAGDTSHRLQELESKVERLDGKIKGVEEAAGFAFFVFFLFGVVLAMWAQRRGESGCLWFILGFIPLVNVVAALVALSRGPDSGGRRGLDRGTRRPTRHAGDVDRHE
jgi:hypothetical protein